MNEKSLPMTLSAETMDECKRKLFDMYGDRYEIIERGETILHTGFLGLVQKSGVKVKYIEKVSPIMPGSSSPKYDNDFSQSRDEILKRVTQNSSVTSLKQMAVMNDKLDQLTKSIENISDQINSGSEVKSESIMRIEEMLEENEFTKAYIKEISEKIRSCFNLAELDDFASVERAVVDWIGESISIARQKAVRPPHIIVIVGPTGVGKTTTIAKIAAQHIKLADQAGISKPQIRFITVDHTRVAAEEQLLHYGEVMEIPVSIAEKTEDLKKLLEECNGSTDLVLIDTSGYSPNDSESIAKLKKLLSVERFTLDVYLACAASTKTRDLRNIMKNYEPFDYGSVILTKCDETTQYGNVISVLNEMHKSVSYVTNGQAVARNISAANVVDFLIRLNGFKIDRNHIEERFSAKYAAD